jgi:hypothetical protein
LFTEGSQCAEFIDPKYAKLRRALIEVLAAQSDFPLIPPAIATSFFQQQL